MRTSEFDYDLPPDLIAQDPVANRDQSRLLVLQRNIHRRSHRTFFDLPHYLQPSDVLVLNDSRVIAARLLGSKITSGGRMEMLLIEEIAPNDWWAMLRPAKRVRVGSTVEIDNRSGQRTGIIARVVEKNLEGHCRVVFSGVPNLSNLLDELGGIPLPPYIQRDRSSDSAQDRERYQTVFARSPGSVAAPTAGLHLTTELLQKIHASGVTICAVTLHVGPGTFAPVKAETLEGHIMHAERFQISEEAARTINKARRAGGRVIAVGTTTLRVLESVAAANDGQLIPGEGRTRIFIHPPYQFKVIDALITNFHLPRSTLLMLVSAFAAPGETSGRGLMLETYAEAIRERYRFFSYGDAMLII